MKIMSTVPGRLRLDLRELRGRRVLCEALEEHVSAAAEVRRVEASHRTGRVLVLYDVERTDADRLRQQIRQVLDARKHFVLSRTAERSARPRSTGGSGSVRLRELAREAAVLSVKTLLPPPWNTLVPIATRLMRVIP